MSKFRTIGRIAAVALMALAPSAAAAAIEPVRVTPGSAAVPVAIFGMMGFMALIFVLAVGFLVFWILMLVDCARRDWPEKNTWVIILVISILIQLHWLAALVYYFTVKRPNLGSVGTQTAPPQPPAPPVTPPPAA